MKGTDPAGACMCGHALQVGPKLTVCRLSSAAYNYWPCFHVPPPPPPAQAWRRAS